MVLSRRHFALAEDRVLISDGRLVNEYRLLVNGKPVLHQSSPRGITAGPHELQAGKRKTISPEQLAALADLFKKPTNQRKLDELLSDYVTEVSLPISILFYKFHKSSKEAKRPAPTLVSNIIGGSGHHDFGPGFTEIMVIIKRPASKNGLPLLSYVYDQVKQELVRKYGAASVMNGSEGAFSPAITNYEALEILAKVIGEINNPDIGIAIDVAATVFAQESTAGKFHYLLEGKRYTSLQLVDYYKKLLKSFPDIQYLEDPFAPTDLEGWRSFKSYADKYHKGLMVVADDLTATKATKIKQLDKLFNAVICKPNQAGTVTALTEAIAATKAAGKICIASQRSVESDGDIIIDLGLELDCEAFKLGAPARERIVKYNSLFRKLAHYSDSTKVRDAIVYLENACDEAGYRFIIRGSGAYGATFISNWSDIDASVQAKTVDLKFLNFLKKLYAEYSQKFGTIKLSITPFDSNDNPAANPYHHHGIKPLTYTAELAQQFAADPVFNFSIEGAMHLNAIQANSLYRYYEIYYKLIGDYIKGNDNDLAVAEAWHRLVRALRTCLEILHPELLEQGKINEKEHYHKLTYNKTAEKILLDYHEIRSGWADMNSDERQLQQVVAVGHMLRLRQQFLKELKKL